MLADERCPSRETPGRAVVEGSLAWVDKATAQLRVLHLLPETPIVQMGVVYERLRGPHGSPGKAARLGSMVDFFRWQAGDEVGHQLFDDMVPMRFNHLGVLVFGVFEVAGHAV